MFNSNEAARIECSKRRMSPSALLAKSALVIGSLTFATAGSVVYEIATSEDSPAEAAMPSCDTVIVNSDEWLQGYGVEVRSNGVNQGTADSCSRNGSEIYDLNATPPQYGFGWQCVELVNRLYTSRGWSERLWLGEETNYGAKNLFDYARDGKYPGLKAYANGTGYIPVPGDMIIHGETSLNAFGHVAVFDHFDDSGNMIAVEQNASETGQATYGFDSDSGTASKTGYTIKGFIHAEKNTLLNDGKMTFSSIASQEEFYSDETGYVYTKAGGRAWPIKPRDQWTAQDTAHWGNEPVGPVGKDDVHNYEVGHDQNGYNSSAHPPAEGSRLYYDGGDGRQYFFYNGRGFHLASDAEAAGVGAKPLERVPLTENRMNPFLGQAANVPNETLYRIYGSNEVRFMSQTGSGFQSLTVPSEIYKECHIDFKGRKYVVLPSSAASRLQDSPLTISNSPAACAYPNDRVATYDDTKIGPSGSVEQWRINGDGGSIPYTRRHYPLPLAVAYHTGNAPKYDTPNVPGDFRSLPLGPIMNLPNGIFLRNGSNLEVYRWDATSTGGSLRKVPSADTLKCLGNPAITDIRGDMMAGTPQGSLLACTYEGKILYVTAEQRQIISGKARKIGNPAISACLQVRSKTGTPLQVSSSIFNSYTLDAKPAYCNYEQELGLNFVRETGDTQVYLVKAGGTKQRVGSLCADQTLKKYHVYEVPKGETAGHTTATNAWFASTTTCNALPGDGTKA